MKKLILIILALCITAGAYAGGYIAQSGAFADIGLARPSGIGNCFVAVADDASTVFYNPAGIPTSMYRDITFMYGKQKMLVPYNFFSIIVPLGKLRGVGFGVAVSGDKLYEEKQFILSYAENLDRFLMIIEGFNVGVSAKLQFAGFGNNTENEDFEKVKGSAGGFGLDIGALWAVNSNIQAGVVFRNAFSFIGWNTDFDGETSTYAEGTPLSSTVALRYKITDFMATAELEDIDLFRIGLEKTIFNYVDLRCGMSQTLDLEQYKEYFLGLGVGRFEFGRQKEFSTAIDFSWGFERLANTWKIQTSFRFK